MTTTAIDASPFPEACRTFLSVGSVRLRGMRVVGRDGAAEEVVISPDGRFLLVTGRDGATLWDATRGSVLWPAPASGDEDEDEPSSASGPCFSPGSMRAAWVSYHGGVHVVELPTPTDDAIDLALTFAARGAKSAFTADGRSLVVLDGGPSFASYSLERGGERVWVSRPQDLSEVDRSALARDARVSATVSFDGTCVVIYPQTGTCLFRLGEPGSVRSVTVAADGQKILAGTADGARLWDTASGTLLRRLPGAPSDVVALSADGARALGGPRDGRLALWDVLSGQVLERLDLSPFLKDVRDVTFAPDGRTFVVAGDTRRGLDGSRKRNAVLMRFELAR